MRNQISPVHVTTHKSKKGRSSKLDGMQSISTLPTFNPLCMAHRKVNGSICEKCFSDRFLGISKNLKEALARNTEYLSTHEMTDEEAGAVLISTLYARMESFGDVQNITQVRNYIRIIKAHPLTNFGVWSKNISLWRQGFEELGKPDNCTFVQSSIMLNKEASTIFWFTDHVFTVWDKYHLADSSINCGGKSCQQCGHKCYHRGGELFINERLK